MRIKSYMDEFDDVCVTNVYGDELIIFKFHIDGGYEDLEEGIKKYFCLCYDLDNEGNFKE